MSSLSPYVLCSQKNKQKREREKELKIQTNLEKYKWVQLLERDPLKIHC